MTKTLDRDQNLMYELWGTTEFLTSDYGIFEKKQKKMLREISNDDTYSKKTRFFHVQNELHSKIRNDDDYDDWEYGTEPLFG
jgi:hypothetical protein